MQLKVMTLAFCPQSGQFDTSELEAFLSEQQLLSHQEHFFVHDGLPYLVLLLSYGQAPVHRAATRAKKSLNLPPAEKALFETLRKWRKGKADEIGKPPYSVFNNDELVEIVRKKPTTLAALDAIHGIGEAKCQQFGRDVLAIIAGQTVHKTVNESTGKPTEAKEGDDGQKPA